MSIADPYKAIVLIALTVAVSVSSCRDVPVKNPKSHKTTVVTNTKVRDTISDNAKAAPDTIRQIIAVVDSSDNKPTVQDVKPTIKKEVAKKPVNVDTRPKKKAAAQPAKKRIGKFSFDDDVHDFGTINSGDIIEHAFTFTNEGNKALTIRDADVTCGCTYPSFPFLPIAPGEKGVIKVRYNSVGKEGRQEAKVTINSDASKSPYYLYLRGNVVKDTSVTPVKIDSTSIK